MKYFYLLFVCCLWGIQQTSAACSNPSPLSNANGTKLQGVWYVVGSTAPTGEVCRRYNLIQTTSNNFIYDYTNGTSTQITTTQGKLTPSISILSLYNDYLPSTSTSSTYVKFTSTDYIIYIVTYKCSPDNIDIFELWARNSSEFTAALASAGTAIPATVTLTQLNNNCLPTNQKKKILFKG